ncbi:MAG: GNVR domain-containing protein [bacterium]
MSSVSFPVALFRWRGFVIRATIAAAVIAVAVSLLLPPTYIASATILPPREGATGGGLLQMVSQLGSDLSVGSGRAARRLFGRSQAADVMLGVLQSRNLAGQIVDRFDLVAVYDLPSREHAIRALVKKITADSTPEGLLRITVEDRSAERAADMANAYMQLLDEFNRRTSVEDARRSVQFVEGAIEANRQRRDEASERLRRFQEENGAVQLTDQAQATVEALAKLESEKMELEIRRGVLEKYSRQDNVELRQISDQIREIDRVARDLNGGVLTSDSTATRPGRGSLLRLSVLPKLAMEFADLKREVLVQEKVYEFLAAQYEEARIQEASTQETIQFLDVAVPPIKKSKPRRSLIVMMTTALAALTAAAIAVGGESLLPRLAAPGALPEELEQRLAWLPRLLRWLRDWGHRSVGS